MTELKLNIKQKWLEIDSEFYQQISRIDAGLYFLIIQNNG